MRLCFLVKVLKASGLNVGGGSNMGSIVGIAGLNAGGGGGRWAWVGGIGCSGVPKAGEEESTGG